MGTQPAQGTESQDKGTAWWLLLAAAGLGAPIAWAIVSMLSPQTDPTAFMNVRLGMSSSQIRSQVERSGAWSSEPGPEGLLVLTWTAEDSADSVEEARFEIHDGLLVAIRARVRGQEIAEERLTIAPDAVRSVIPGPDGITEMTVLARGCPVHEEEVRQLIEHR